MFIDNLQYCSHIPDLWYNFFAIYCDHIPIFCCYSNMPSWFVPENSLSKGIYIDLVVSLVMYIFSMYIYIYIFIFSIFLYFYSNVKFRGTLFYHFFLQWCGLWRGPVALLCHPDFSADSVQVYYHYNSQSVRSYWI